MKIWHRIGQVLTMQIYFVIITFFKDKKDALYNCNKNMAKWKFSI